MMLAARGAFLAARRKRAPTAKSYVQDGLIAMWDGIENAGLGVHDAAARALKDLVGDRDAALVDGVVEDNCVTGTRAVLAQCSDAPLDFVQCEVVFLSVDYASISGSNTYQAVFKSNGTYNPQITVGLRTHQWVISPAFQKKGIVDYRVFDRKMSVSATRDILYVNGIGVAVVNEPAIGTRNYTMPTFGGQYATNKFFTGSIFCVRLYSRALTAEEVAANYAVDRARFNLPDAT